MSGLSPPNQSDAPPDGGDARAQFDRLLGDLRPKLHRYCARMTGSIIDGEDTVQDALIKAIEAFAQARPIANVEGWLFRIAHNAALDFLRKRARQQAMRSEEDLDRVGDPASAVSERQAAAAASLRIFMRLPAAQRSSVILMDVLGYSLDEVGGIIETSVPAVKAHLHRGRERLRVLAQEPDDLPAPVLAETERARLAGYVARFNARDFDAVRDMLGDDVRLELVNKTRMKGRVEVSGYFGNYSKIADWHLVPGLVEGRPAILVFDPGQSRAAPTYFVLLRWSADKIAEIRDFRHAPYVIDGAEYLV